MPMRHPLWAIALLAACSDTPGSGLSSDRDGGLAIDGGSDSGMGLDVGRVDLGEQDGGEVDDLGSRVDAGSDDAGAQDAGVQIEPGGSTPWNPAWEPATVPEDARFVGWSRSGRWIAWTDGLGGGGPPPGEPRPLWLYDAATEQMTQIAEDWDPDRPREVGRREGFLVNPFSEDGRHLYVARRVDRLLVVDLKLGIQWEFESGAQEFAPVGTSVLVAGSSGLRELHLPSDSIRWLRRMVHGLAYRRSDRMQAINNIETRRTSVFLSGIRDVVGEWDDAAFVAQTWPEGFIAMTAGLNEVRFVSLGGEEFVLDTADARSVSVRRNVACLVRRGDGGGFIEAVAMETGRTTQVEVADSAFWTGTVSGSWCLFAELGEDGQTRSIRLIHPQSDSSRLLADVAQGATNATGFGDRLVIESESPSELVVLLPGRDPIVPFRDWTAGRFERVEPVGRFNVGYDSILVGFTAEDGFHWEGVRRDGTRVFFEDGTRTGFRGASSTANFEALLGVYLAGDDRPDSREYVMYGPDGACGSVVLPDCGEPPESGVVFGTEFLTCFRQRVPPRSEWLCEGADDRF